MEIPSSPWMHPAETTVVWHLLSLVIDPGLAQSHYGAAACEMRAILYVNNVQVEELIINADCSESKSKQHLAGKTINERVTREFILQTTWRFAGYFLVRHLRADVVAVPLMGIRRKVWLRYWVSADGQVEGGQVIRTAGPEQVWAGIDRLQVCWWNELPSHNRDSTGVGDGWVLAPASHCFWALWTSGTIVLLWGCKCVHVCVTMRS